MSTGDIVIDRANLSDVQGILKLAEANEVQRGGMLSAHLTHEAVVMTIEKLPTIVGRKDGRIVGFLLTWEKTAPTGRIVRAMLEAYPGNRDSYIYGPVCVDAAMRGRGLAASMFAELRRLLPNRQGLLFINTTNEQSLRAHRRMGMCSVAKFNYEDNSFEVFAYEA